MTNFRLLIRSLVLLLALSTYANAQSISTTTCPGAGCVTYNVSGQGSIGIQITGTWVGTVTFQSSLGTLSTSTFTSLLVFPSSSQTGVTTTTGNGVWSTAIAGFNQVRVVFTAYTSGTAVVTYRSTSAAKNNPSAPGGSGTVTSVGLALPTSVFDISGSPVTTAGTLTATFDTQTANTTFAGPTTGAATTPTFRSLVAADVNSFLTSAYVIGKWTGTCNSSSVLGGDGVCAIISSAFSGITSGTNTSATMVVGTGASLSPTSATVGTINANQINGTALSSLATGPLANTITTGVPRAASAHDLVIPKACIAASASTTNYTCTTSPSFTPATGDLILFKADATNTTTTPNLNVNSVGNVLIKKNLYAGAAIVGDIISGSWYLILYDGTTWVIIGQSGTPNISTNFTIASNGQAAGVQIDGLQSAGSTNVWQTISPGNKYIGVMSDHQLNWRSSATGSFFSAGSIDTGLGRNAAGVVEVNTGTAAAYRELKIRSIISGGTVPGISGCTAGTQVGGGTAGTFVSGTTGACTVVLTFAFTAPNGWACSASDRTTPANLISQSASSTTTCTITGTTVASDVISFMAMAY